MNNLELYDGFLNARLSLERKRVAAVQAREAANSSRATLRSGILESGTRPTQVNAGALGSEVDVRWYNDLVREYGAWSRKGFFGKLVGNPMPKIHAEGLRLLDAADARLRVREAQAEQAAAELRRTLDGFEPEFAAWHQETGLGTLERHLDDDTISFEPAPLYTNIAEDAFEKPNWSALGWLELDPERSWATLPSFGGPERCVTILPRDLGLAAGAALARHWVLGLLARARGRSVLITWIETVGRGAGAGPLLRLLDSDKELLDGQVWSEPDQIGERLRRITDRVSYIQQRCLQDRFASLAEYNAQAGELAEPYHLVCVVGYPRGFTEELADRLRTLVSHSRKAGVGVLIVCDPGMAATATPQGFDTESPTWLRQLDTTSDPGAVPHWWKGEHFGAKDGAEVVYGYDNRFYVRGDGILLPLDFRDAPAEVQAAIVADYAVRSEEAKNVVVTLSDDSLGPSLGRAEAGAGIAVNIGKAGRGEWIHLDLGTGMAQNVLVGGLPGSGKSSLFHTFLTQAIQKYDWNELELYLLDFKQGVEFKPYAQQALPQARVIAIESEREFGISVLRGLEAELTRRAELFRKSLVDSLEEYRKLADAEQLPRIVLICDEFQVLLSADDRMGQDAAGLLDALVRQGRAFGIHLILGTQTLQGMAAGALIKGTLDLIPVRIALKMGENDSRLFLSEGNDAGARLTRPGEAVLNTDAGRPEGNTLFQVALTDDPSRDAAVAKVRGRADLEGFTRRPRVFDGSIEVAVDEPDALGTLKHELGLPGKGLRVVLGEPISLNGSGSVLLARRSGANLLLVAREAGLATGLVGTALASIAGRAQDDELELTIVDCLGVDEDGGDVLEGMAELTGATFGRRTQLARVLAELDAEVKRRVDEEDFSAGRRVLVLNALHRARDLGDEPQFEEDHPRQQLYRVLRDGPDVGVHCVLAADAAETVDRRLGRDGLREAGLRVVGRTSPDASRDLLGSESAASVRPQYAYLYEVDDNRVEKIRPFTVPALEQLENAVAALTDRSAAGVVHPG